MDWEFFAEIDDVADDSFLIREIKGRSYGMIRIDDEYHALWNFCPHEGAEICRGKVGGTTLPSEVGKFNFGLKNKVISCPWHGWEFDIRDGKPLFCHNKPIKVLKMKVMEDNGKLFIKA